MKKYSIGLDIGVASVGWAVIDENNQLVRYKKKNMWGSRLFDEAQTAEARRVNRSARRRLKRRAQRINFLQQLLAPMVLSVDDGFFMKMNESMLYKKDEDDDKGIPKYSPLYESLKEAGYLEKTKGDLKKYPTIYHLRKALMESDEKFDPRLVYLAIHHIIKYRGNFLYPGQEFKLEDTHKIDENLSQVFEYMEERLGFDLNELETQKDQIIAILKNDKSSRSTRRSEIQQLFNFKADQKTCFTNILGAFLGFKIDAHKIFTDLDETKIEFAKFEEKRDDLSENLGERIEFFDLLQSVYSWVVLQDMLRGEASISQAMINKYDEYAQDLQFIKKLFKEYLTKQEYQEFFRSKPDVKGEFKHYTKYTKSGWNHQEFIKDLKSFLDKAQKAGADLTSPEAQRFLKRLDEGEAFSKLRMSDNGAIPYQLHKNELIKIIEKQGKFYPELLEKVDNGDGQQKYKLVRLIEHRIPYYVGPLQTGAKNQSEFAWMKRRDNGDITPFNFYQKIDKLGSAEAFIERLTNNCTYLPDQPVLPKFSLLISEFNVRNEIKNMRINGEQAPIELENALFRDLFLKKKRVTAKDVSNYLKTHHYPALLDNSQPDITGLSDKSGFNSSMSSYIDLTQKIGLIFVLDTSSDGYQMAEKLIKWVTIFEDEDILQEKIRREYSSKLSEDQISKIAKLNYSGWSSLSQKLLTEIKSHPKDSEFGKSIIELMRTEPDNFMQLISSEKFGIKARLTAELEKFMADNKETDYDLVDSLPASPAVKRGIWQAMKLVKEIVELQDGQKPEKIYIEMARGSDGSDQTAKRKKTIDKLYNKVELNTAYVAKEELKQLKNELKEFEKIDKRAWELYFRQLGKCAYSGKTINPDQIAQTCQIDHIIPRSLVKDDSIDNKVLVLSAENQRKREEYPLSSAVVKRQVSLWRYWLENGLMSQSKFNRLVQAKEKYDKDMVSGGFIKRQLVEAQQITKHVASLFNQLYKQGDVESIVEPVKAQITSEFRQKFNFPKSRSINDFHHAKDAYLTAVLGKYLAEKFTDRKRSVLYERYMKFAHQLPNGKTETRHDREKRELGFVLHGFITDQATGEINDNHPRLQTVRRVMKFNDCLVTKKTEINSNGQLFDATLYKKSNRAKAKIMRGKDFPVNKYGGHTSDKMAHMIAVKFIDYKGKTIRKLVKVPLRVALIVKNDEELKTWLTNEFGVAKVTIIKNKIPKYQIIRTKDDSLLILISQANAGNFKQLRLPYEIENRYAHLQKLLTGLGEFNYTDVTLARRMHYRLSDLVRRSGSPGSYQYQFVDDISHKINNFLNQFYQKVLEKISVNIPFYGEKMIKKIEDFYEVFGSSDDIIQKFKFLEEMLLLTSANAEYPTFEKLDISKKYFNSGTGRITTKTFYLDDIVFYDYSITGLRVKKTKL